MRKRFAALSLAAAVLALPLSSTACRHFQQPAPQQPTPLCPHAGGDRENSAEPAVPAKDTAWTQPKPFEFFRNTGKTIEADPNKTYMLSEAEGPYLILATALAGPTARQDAHELVFELRSKYKWNAFVFEKNFTYNAKQDFGQSQSPLSRTSIKYNNTARTDFAVMIGNFPSLEDNQYKRMLEEVRKCQPESLKGKASATAFSFPMAYGVINPMLPPEYQRGTVDAKITAININRPYTLLQNPRRYTIKIAEFAGRAVMRPEEIKAIETGKNARFDKEESALEIGERTAAALCKALRERGVEAYEFHDRFSSIVTVGGFDQPDKQMPNGTVIADPQIQQIIQQYKRRTIDGIQCSSQPILIDVPRAATARK